MNSDEYRKRNNQRIKKVEMIERSIESKVEASRELQNISAKTGKILDDLDRDFEAATGLQGNDIKFLFAATGLQIARIVILNELTKKQPAGPKNRNEKELHKFQKEIMKKFKQGEIVAEEPYYASMKHIITSPKVPYDATQTLSKGDFISQGLEWPFDVEEFLPTEDLKLFEGANHRFSTLGHDPILGLVFGTANIMTNTITCVKRYGMGDVSIPVITTNHVLYTKELNNPRIGTYASTLVMLERMYQRKQEEKSAWTAALIKQIIHIGTDLYTPCGIQIPGGNLVLSNSNIERLTKTISTGDVVKVGASAIIALLINDIIGLLHTLMYDPSTMESRNLYSVRTRKILMYSNTIATASNVIWVGGNMLAGNESAINQLDIGGLLVTIHRLITDTEYIRKIKEEFVFGGLNKMIQDVSWE